LKPHYNLVDEPWIPCLDRQGTTVDRSITDVLVDAHKLTAIRDQSPLVTAALHRLMLAILYAALDGPRSASEWDKIWRGRSFDASRVQDYLSKWRHRLDLFDAEHPFYQVAGFEIPGKKPTDDRSTSVLKMWQELASGNNDTLFDHTFEEQDKEISPSEAARGLITSQAFAVGGGVGSTSNLFGKHPNLTHAPMIGGTAVFLVGANLFETLTLNLLVLEDEGRVTSSPDDRPIWEHDEPFLPQPRTPAGLLEVLTWPARAARLLPDSNEAGSLCVKRMFFTQGCALPRDTHRPEWAYRLDPQKGATSVGVRVDRALWRDCSALFAAADKAERQDTRPLAVAQAARFFANGTLTREHALRCFAIGLGTHPTMAAKVLMWRMEGLPVPAAVLNDAEGARTLRSALQSAESAAKYIREALKEMTNFFKKGVLVIRERAMRSYWPRLELSFPRFLELLGEDPDEAASWWAITVRQAALKAFDLAADNALARSARELEGRVAGEQLLLTKLACDPLLAKTNDPNGGAQ